MKPVLDGRDDEVRLFWPLRTIGALSALVFVIGVCMEVMVAYQIKSREQHLLIAGLLVVLSAWAIAEAHLLERRNLTLPVRWLRVALAMQLAYSFSRALIYFFSGADEASVYHLAASFGMLGLVFPLPYIAIFLWVSNAIVNLLLHNEKLRAGILEELNRRLEIEASRDGLTGLATRRIFRDQLAHDLTVARRNDRIVAVFFLDLDGFKPVNDRYGHEAGDLVLQEVSQRWKSCIRETDLLARVGGDEFAICVSNLTSAEAVESIAKLLVAKLADDFQLADGQRCRVGVSLGIGLYPIHGKDVDELLAAADGAMYASKKAGKNRYCLAGGSTGPV